MLDFKEPKITDKPWVDQCLSHAHSMNCEYTFGNIFVWRTAYVTCICHYKDFLLIRYGRGADRRKKQNSLHPNQGTKAVLLKTPWYHPNCKG